MTTTSSLSPSSSSTGSSVADLTATAGPLDVNSIVSQLMSVADQPLNNLQTAASGLQSQISVFGKVKSLLGTLQTAAAALADPTTWGATAATSSNSAAVTATSTGNAAQGNYSVSVSQLAQAQTIASSAYASATTVVGGGTLQIQFGTTGANGSGFTAGTSAPASITIPANATISDVRDAINSAGVGLTATLVSDGTGVRLMVSSTTTGAANGFSITATGDGTGGNGLAALGFDPTGANGSNMALTQTGQDAKYTLGGIALTSPTNNVTGALDDVNLNLQQVTTAPVQVGVSPDTSSLSTAVNSFITAYNAVNTELTTDLAYNASTQTAGALQGNVMMIQLQQTLSNMLGNAVGSGSIQRLADVGISMNSDGSLSLNQTTFNAAATNPAAIKTLFSNNDATNPNNDGIGVQMNTALMSALGVNGSITASLDGLNQQVQDNSQDQATLQQQLSLQQQRLTAQYGALNAQLSQMQSLSTSLTSQLAALNTNNSSSGS